LHRGIDEVQRSVRVTLTRHDEQIRRSLLQGPPALVEAVDDPDNFNAVAVGKYRLNGVAVESGVDSDEGVDSLGHRQRTGFSPASKVCALTKPGITVVAP